MKPTKALTQAVNKIVNRKIETKFKIDAPYNYTTNQTLEDFVQFSTAITSTNELFALIPKVSQGTDDYQRVGQTIQPKSLKVNIQCALGTANSCQIVADFFFLTAKNVKDIKLTNQILTGNLLNDGQGGNIPYDGTSYTAMCPINSSEFTLIKRKRVILRKGGYDYNTMYSGGGPATDTMTYNSAMFSVKIPLPKKLTYLTAADLQPTNSFPFMMVGFHAIDNFGNIALTPTIPLYVQAQSQLYFKDA